MPLYEIETNGHIMIGWADSTDAARALAVDLYPEDQILRISKRPRDLWVISKRLLGLRLRPLPVISPANAWRKPLATSCTRSGFTAQKTGTDLQEAQKAIETNMSLGW